ncbi:Protein of unknown function DUF295 [Macleaya cordata]|uniref:Uncharacterized protein n=1 Tax=Macleaya cordata TaxID=56857 RepID=A0A200PT32_MACCD|nr:Protein of unknown function DUF295 [Macleaya cordata]
MGGTGGKKEKQVSNNGRNTRPWPDLPDQLIKLISKRLSLIEFVNFDGISKTWRSTSKKCNSNHQFPWLELTHRKTHDIHQVYSVPEVPWTNAWWNRRYWRPPQDPIIGSSHGQIVMRRTKSLDYYLFLPPWSTRGLPLLDHNIPFRHIVFTSRDNYKASPTALVLTGAGSKPGPMFYSTLIGEYKWVQVECSTLLDPNSLPNQGALEFTNAVALNGKYYALSLQGTLAVIDVIIESDGSRPRVTILGASRAIPSVRSRCFKEYLVESGGEILLIFLISRKSFNKIDDIEVFRLDLTSVSWIKMECLGDRTFFIGLNCCMPVCASELGCKANCIYFRQDMNDGWWEFNMGNGNITPGWNADSTDKSPTWVTPDLE